MTNMRGEMNESKTLDYAIETYRNGSIEAVLDIWEEVDRGELTYREASTTLGMAHADFLRVVAELGLFDDTKITKKDR
jgi:hypothetical protein